LSAAAIAPRSKIFGQEIIAKSNEKLERNLLAPIELSNDNEQKFSAEGNAALALCKLKAPTGCLALE